ncbi:RNA 2',3'-cyclic phosphodiesterase [Streptomyces silvisoli]|uniref:RNA 2',3'-cyclic phosphodiesterase n=1 Tax=Streptomyces silvisoli TaxID=3034235 RepID=A0ABT5ZUH6_9ACTN|nr:RNA 2',3'-cyclic phosphodiesterase [Streptomyces silvisoli]MDF3293477.1 RNA 2',3'-cyclic phosphodiesterase [Streptomyces silvisoli]
MRLFVALWPSQEALRDLDRAENRLRAAPDARNLRWAGEGGHHLTLAFLGEVPEESLPDLTARLERAARRHAPLPLRLAGGGRFGDRTLWVGVEGDVRGLGHLADSLAAGARRAGVEMEDRPFRAHLTLARGRPHRHTALRPFTELLTDFSSHEWTADHIDLVRSHPPAAGTPGAHPRYEVLHRWPLGH